MRVIELGLTRPEIVPSVHLIEYGAGANDDSLRDFLNNVPRAPSGNEPARPYEDIASISTASLLCEIEEVERRMAALKGELARRIQATTSAAAAPTGAPTPAPAPAPALTLAEHARYGRQMIVDGFGLPGQLRLRHAAVLVVGCGGLGCPVAAYLGGAGVGVLGLADGDVVETSNLHRQILHGGAGRVGWAKTASARAAVEALNPHVRVQEHPAALADRATAEEVLAGYDVVVDCTDNPAVRYLLSDVCVAQVKPMVSASALKTEGQLMVHNHPARPAGWGRAADGGMVPDGDGGVEPSACYRCMNPTPPPAGAVVSCGDGGIIGPVVGLMGVLQAVETIRLLTSDAFWHSWREFGRGSRAEYGAELPDGLPGFAQAEPERRMIMFSAFSAAQFRSVKVRGRRGDCGACSAAAGLSSERATAADHTLTPLCRIGAGRSDEEAGEAVAKVMAPELVREMGLGARAVVLVDVRPEAQYSIARLGGSVNVPLGELIRLDRRRARMSEGGSGWVELRRRLCEPVRVACMRDGRVLGGDEAGFGQLGSVERLVAPLEDLVRAVRGAAVQSALAHCDVAAGQPDEVPLFITFVCRRGIDSVEATRLVRRGIATDLPPGPGDSAPDGNVCVSVWLERTATDSDRATAESTAVGTEKAVGASESMGGAAEQRRRCVRVPLLFRDLDGGLVRWGQNVDGGMPVY